jgi:hypothetical protein
MSRHWLHLLLGEAVLLAFVGLTLTVPGCGGGTSAHDGGAPRDAVRDLPHEPSPAETGANFPDAPASPVQDTAISLVPDAVAMDLARGDGDEVDATVSDGLSTADAVATDAVATDLARGDGDEVDATISDGLSTADAVATDTTARADALADSPDVGKLDGAIDLLVDPVCASADSTGFFAACTSCVDPSNCDSVTVSGRTRQACGCEADTDCPCGLTCGCSTIAPSVQLCGICRR